MSTVADRADQLADMRLIASAEARCWEGWTVPEVPLGDAAGDHQPALERTFTQQVVSRVV